MREVTHKDKIFTRCIIHRKQLSAKKLSPKSNNVMNREVEIVNDIRGRALHSRLFEAPRRSMNSPHHHLLFHAKLRCFEIMCLFALFRVDEGTKSVFI